MSNELCEKVKAFLNEHDRFCKFCGIQLTEVAPGKFRNVTTIFDRQGNRIGYGAGYYDRFLLQNPHLKKIGLAYACQEVEAVPTEENDIPLDMVITENGIREF